MTPTLNLVDITLVVACVALVIAVLLYVMMQRRLSRIKSVDRDLDTRAIVQEFSQRLRRLEERLVDQKVRFEILELRQQKQQNEAVPNRSMMLMSETPSSFVTKSVEPSLYGRQVYETSEKSELELQRPLGDESRTSDSATLVRSEMEALRFVLESGTEGATARDTQEKIRRSREHTARMMNALFKKGLVERNSETRPFSYRITENGKRAVKK